MIRPFWRFLLLILPFLAMSAAGFAQRNDFRLRLSGEIETELLNDLKGSLEYEHRFDQNLSTFDKAFFEPKLSYDLPNDFRIGAKYRIMYDQNRSRERELSQRISAYVRYGIDIDDFELKLTTTLQYGFDDLTNTVFSSKQKLINRNAAAIEYNWFGQPYTPFVEYEFFVHTNHPNGAIVNQWRLKMGTSVKLSRASSLDFFYLFENEFNVVAPVDSHVIGAKYAYSF